ncbi:HTH-type transcriptional regulator MurR [Streptomyces canarius]
MDINPIADVVTKLAGSRSSSTFADTAAGLDTVQLGAAVTALAAARRTDVYGIGASGLVAQDLTQKLLRIGLIAHAHSDPHLAVTNAVQLRSGDVALAITHSGLTGDVIEPLRVAFERGATTVAITGRPNSPVTQYADLGADDVDVTGDELRPADVLRTSQLLVVDWPSWQWRSGRTRRRRPRWPPPTRRWHTGTGAVRDRGGRNRGRRLHHPPHPSPERAAPL